MPHAGSGSPLHTIDALIQRDPKLQPSLDNEALQGILRAILRDLETGKTSFPAECISRHLAYGGVMAYAGPLLIRGGGFTQMPGYQEWWVGLSLPPLLLDQAFAVITMGRDWVFREIDGVLNSTDGGGYGRWFHELIRAKVVEASARLRLDPSGLGALAWFVDEQLEQRSDAYYQAGLVASLRLYVAFCAAVATEGFTAGGPILGSPR